jgi:flagellar biosynthesis protein FliR
MDELLQLSIHADAGLYATLMAFVRIAGLLHAMPLIKMSVVPVPIRVALAMVLAVTISPLVPVAEADVTWAGPLLAVRAISEAMLGLAMGFACALLLTVLDIAGTFLGMNAGLGIATQFDPISGSNSLVISRFTGAIGFLIFLALDLHHQIFLGLVDSFLIAPPGTGFLAPSAGLGLSSVLGALFMDAMRISMPVVAAVLIFNLVSALVTRFAQQMNIYFSVGLPANAMAGLWATSLAIPALAAAVVTAGAGMRGLMGSLVGVH